MSRRVIIQRKVLDEADLDCPDCGSKMNLVPFKDKIIYRCTRHPITGCRGSHGAHPSGAPLGIPAPWPVREARKKAHAVFDQVWQSGKLSRRAAYRWLRGCMGLMETAAHISCFDIEQCERVLRYVHEDFGFTPPLDLGAGVQGFVEISL